MRVEAMDAKGFSRGVWQPAPSLSLALQPGLRVRHAPEGDWPGRSTRDRRSRSAVVEHGKIRDIPRHGHCRAGRRRRRAVRCCYV